MAGVLDMDVVEELLSLTGDDEPELLLDLIGMFLEDAPIKLKTIQDGLASGDYEALATAAHSLKGSAGNLGAHLVQHDCNLLQTAKSSSEEAMVREIVPKLEKHFADAMNSLTELRDKYR